MLAERVTEWTTQWKREGHQEGIVEGEAIFLMRMLQSRFGPLSESYRDRIAHANSNTLLMWGDRFHNAGSIEEIFRE
jgi:hypothetical protein